MADEIRIVDLNETNNTENGDFIVIDSTADGTRKYNIGAKLADIDSKIGNVEALLSSI